MYDFRDEMYVFKKEMYNFRANMYQFEVKTENFEEETKKALQKNEEYINHLLQVTDVIQSVVTNQYTNHEKRISKLERIVGFN